MANARKPVVHRLANRREPHFEERDRGRIEEAVRTLLSHVGEDPAREGLRRTPQRMVQALEFLTSGYSQDPKDAINGALFVEEDYQEMILCKDLDFYSLCEHHVLPFMGKAHVADLPQRRIIGLSKLARKLVIRLSLVFRMRGLATRISAPAAFTR